MYMYQNFILAISIKSFFFVWTVGRNQSPQRKECRKIIGAETAAGTNITMVEPAEGEGERLWKTDNVNGIK